MDKPGPVRPEFVVTSHLTLSFTPSQAGAEVSGFATTATPSADQSGTADALGPFAAMLDAVIPGPVPVAGIVANVAGAIIDALMPKPDPQTVTTQSSDATLVATLGDASAATPSETPAEATADPMHLIGDLSDLLAALDTALDNGEEPDPAVLDKLGKTLDALASVLGLPAPPATAPITGGPLDQLAAAANRVIGRLTDNGANVPGKLAEVASALTNPAILAKLGIEAGAAMAAEVFDLPAAQPRAEAKQAATQPVTPPDLKLPAVPDGTAKAPPAKSAADDAQAVELKPATKPDTQRPVDPVHKPAQAATDAPSQPPPKAADAPPPAAQAQTAPVQAPAPAAVRVMHAAYQSAQLPQQINIPQLAVEIVSRAQLGTSKFQIRLDPPELGRIDVKMDVDAGGTVNARLTVERSETLDLLQRDQRSLEKALQQAGLDGSKTNLEFSLKQQQSFERPQGNPQHLWLPGGDEPAVTDVTGAAPVQFYRATARAGGVNIFV